MRAQRSPARILHGDAVRMPREGVEGALEQDLERELDGAAAAQEPGREVEIDVVADRELVGGGAVVRNDDARRTLIRETGWFRPQRDLGPLLRALLR